MLLHPPNEDLHLCFHMCDTPELSTGCFTVEDTVHVAFDGACIAKFNEHLSDCTNLLEPMRFCSGFGLLLLLFVSRRLCSVRMIALRFLRVLDPGLHPFSGGL